MDRDILLLTLALIFTAILFLIGAWIYKRLPNKLSSKKSYRQTKNTSSSDRSKSDTFLPLNDIVIERRQEQKENKGEIATYGSKPTYEFMSFSGGISEWRAASASPAERLFSMDKLNRGINNELSRPFPDRIKLSTLRKELEYLHKYNKEFIKDSSRK